MPENSDLLRDTFCDACEQLACMFAEAAGNNDFPDPPDQAVQTSMSFMGPQDGRIVMAVDKAMCPKLAKSMLGLDAEDPKAEIRGVDVLKELLNVTCGNMLTRIAKGKYAFDLSMPEVHDLDKEAWEALQHTPGVRLLLVDGHTVMLNMTMMH